MVMRGVPIPAVGQKLAVPIFGPKRADRLSVRRVLMPRRSNLFQDVGTVFNTVGFEGEIRERWGPGHYLLTGDDRSRAREIEITGDDTPPKATPGSQFGKMPSAVKTCPGVPLCSEEGTPALAAPAPLTALIDHVAETFKRDKGVDLRDDELALERLTEACGWVLRDQDQHKESRISLPFAAVRDNGRPLHLELKMTQAEIQSVLSGPPLPGVRDNCMTCYVGNHCPEHHSKPLVTQAEEPASASVETAPLYPEHAPPRRGWDVICGFDKKRPDGSSTKRATKYVRSDGCVVFQRVSGGNLWWKVDHPAYGMLAEHAGADAEVMMRWADMKVPPLPQEDYEARRARERRAALRELAGH